MTQGNSKALAAAAAGPTTLLGLGLRASSKGLDEQVSVQGLCVCILSRVLHSRQRAAQVDVGQSSGMSLRPREQAHVAICGLHPASFRGLCCKSCIKYCFGVHAGLIRAESVRCHVSAGIGDAGFSPACILHALHQRTLICVQ